MASSAPADTASAERAARLNPFAFPSDTEFRFVLLMVSVLGSSLLLYAAIYEALPPTRDYKRAHDARCALVADPTDFSGTFAERLARAVAYGDCTAESDRLEAGWMLGGVAVVLAVAGGIYWTFPRRRIRQRRLVPIDSSTPDVAAYLSAMCRETVLPTGPAFVWDPLNGTRSGLAFGHLRQHYVALTGGLVKLLYTDRPAFRAVVLHELAHLRNADVDRTYFTVALWQAFVVAALLPFGVSQLVSGRPLGEIADLSWRIVPLAALVYLTRNAVLRAREVYADVRASTWDVPADALRRSIEALRRPAQSWWARLWRVHPDPASRLSALQDTRPLFRVHLWDALGTGVAAGIALPNVIILLGLLVPMPIAMVRPLAASLVCAPLAVGVVGLGVWRATFAALAEGRRPPGAARAGMALALGLVLGQELSLAAVEFSRGQGPVVGPPLILLNVVWGGVLIAVLAFFFRWVAAGASTWLEVTVDDPSPGQAYRIGLGVAGGLLAVWLGVLFFLYLAARTAGSVVTEADLQTLLEAGSQPGPDPIGSQPVAQSASVTLVGLDLLAIASIGVLCAYPLSAWVWRHRRNVPTFASWAFLESSTQPLAMQLQAALRPGRALAAAAVASLVYCVLTFGVYVALLRANDTDALATWTQFGTVPLAIALQVATALVVAAWLPRLPAVHALFASAVAGCSMGIVTIGLLAGFGLLWDDGLVTLFFISAFIIGGACVAGPLALCVAAVAERVRE
jgi:Zn-dependent protease with chaperone function